MTTLLRGSPLLAALAFALPASAQQQKSPPNIILFVADGLRAAAVSPERAPTFAKIRDTGVNFANSHSVFPTITTANASVIATGHHQGDTGDFGNTQYTGFPVVAANNTVVPFIQDNAVLNELNRHHGGNFIAERSIMAAAREKGYLTAGLGKVGPVGIHDLTQLDGKTTIFFDDDTGKKNGIELRPDVVEKLKKAGLPLETPGRAQRSETPGKSTNIIQQKYYRDIVTKVLLPYYKEQGKPFMLLYWSSDPDGTQHSQRDSLNELTPGINGPTSLAAIKVADEDLESITATLKALGLDGNTNIFVTADHGFSTISKQSKTSPAAKLTYERIPEGQLPPGFLAIDLAEALGLPVHEPFLKAGPVDYKAGKHPRRASAILGNDPAKPDVVIGVNGGNDLIYLPQSNARELAPKVVKALLAQDYTSGIFVRDDLGAIAGTLPMSRIGLKGGARTPTPAIVVNFRSATSGCDQPLFCAVTVTDSTLMQGQGHHGSFSRADTANFMAAIGPAFKSGFRNDAPISNADIAPTLAQIIGVKLPPVGKLQGRAITEALVGGKPVKSWRYDLVSAPGDGGLRTVVNMQFVGTTRYLSAAGFPGRTVGLTAPEEKVQAAMRR
jgi:arylsulfatase A-like enzyme